MLRMMKQNRTIQHMERSLPSVEVMPCQVSVIVLTKCIMYSDDKQILFVIMLFSMIFTLILPPT